MDRGRGRHHGRPVPAEGLADGLDAAAHACLVPRIPGIGVAIRRPDQRTAFTPERVAVEKTNGTVVAESRDLPALFAGHGLNTPWGPLHRAHFNGYAMWLYLNSPFLLAAGGVEVREIDPWIEGDEEWRVLRASFPGGMVTHSRQQDFYFDRALDLRRHDYRVDVAGSFAAAQLISEYVEVAVAPMCEDRTTGRSTSF